MNRFQSVEASLNNLGNALDRLTARNRSLEQQNTRLTRYVALLEADLEECLEYFKDRSDVRDGSDGEPSPNKEMQLATMIQTTLYGPGGF